MDSCFWTPNKNKMNCDSMVVSPLTRTPIRQNSIKLKTSLQHHTNLSLLPNHITPPSGLTKFIARNPFEADLTSKLHISVMSPTVFTKINKSKEPSGFTWSIDELALIQPAKIDEYPLQQMHCSDPEIERTAQEAISRFFNENQIIPSPYDVKNIDSKKPTDINTPVKSLEDINLSKESLISKKEKKDSWSQTVLTLPPELPAYLEEILKPYFNFTQDQNQNCDSEEANSSNNSLRRKLLFHDVEVQDESSVSDSTSPSRFESSLVENLSPPQSGMFFHGTPLKNTSPIIQRTYGTPRSRDSLPCDVSPICNPACLSIWSDMSCQSIKSRRKSVAKLDFTNNMSIDFEDKEVQNKENENMCKTLFFEDIKKVGTIAHDYNNENFRDITQTAVSCENSSRFKSEDKENIAPNMSSKSKYFEAVKTRFSENYTLQQSKMLSGNHMNQMTLSSTQDTGYQTSSNTSNITNNATNIDSYCNLTKQNLRWDEHTTREDAQLADWEYTKNMICSTPSKYNKGTLHF